MDYTGQTVVVTGASRGIGLAFVEEFFRRGAKVIGVSRGFSEDYLRPFKSSPERVQLIQADLGQSNGRKRVVDRLLRDHDVDILVNNAGVLTGNFLQQLSTDEIEQCVQVNLLATLQLTRGLLPHFLKRKKGLIVNNASVSAEFYFPGAQVYAATKAGVLQFSKSLSMELLGTGVQCLALLTPGVKTQMLKEVRELYGHFLELDFADSIPADQWVRQVFLAIEEQKSLCYPKGFTRMGLFLNRHWPRAYEKLMLKKFKGQGSAQSS